MALVANWRGAASGCRFGVVPKPVQVAWLTATEELNAQFVRKLVELYPELPVIAVSEFPVETALASRWVAYHPKRTYAENLAAITEELRGLTVAHASVIVEAGLPLWRLRAIALRVSGRRARFYNLRRFMVGSLDAQLRPGMRWMRRVRNPGEAWVPLHAQMAYIGARWRRGGGVRIAMASVELLPGTAVIIPSRDGLQLLRECLPRFCAKQVVVVDNGSSDGTASALTNVEVVVSAEPLSFARAINRGLDRIRYTRVLLLNNDMLAEPGFLAALEAAFEQVPELFCATAQIVFPAGARREETGKAVMRKPKDETEFPVRCDLPLAGEDGTWVLYGSGGCSLFDTAKLRELGGLNEALEPAYVEDLGFGVSRLAARVAFGVLCACVGGASAPVDYGAVLEYGPDRHDGASKLSAVSGIGGERPGTVSNAMGPGCTAVAPGSG